MLNYFKKETRSIFSNLIVALEARRKKQDFQDINTFCMFIGYPRSGHSLVGSLLNAHSNAVICHELHTLGALRKGYSRDEIFAMILQRDQWFVNQRGSSNSGYSYAVKNQWQGSHEKLYVIGDKQGAGTSFSLLKKYSQLENFIKFLDIPVKFVHVVRHPLDNISTFRIRNKAHTDERLDKAIQIYFQLCDVNQKVIDAYPEQVITIHLDMLANHPQDSLKNLCYFLGLSPDEDYLGDCSEIIFPSAKQTRNQTNWSESDLCTVQEMSSRYSFLKDYDINL